MERLSNNRQKRPENEVWRPMGRLKTSLLLYKWDSYGIIIRRCK
ncbi:hypothetical protein CLOSTASPAR_00280 [[Clostridium] asparagiforme DSM 15981]|uniref:Uncharacterized protein n=1 Tax=[Clostridium] asparagiforme DSM 15981 TaxID=518636 RepID=C0CTI2_9FIRM|nr:hypothetical protein CLOSTASPAR_00280 [[Clostridium] asparagiforme DSM 15981]